jgi:hypothetical protein
MGAGASASASASSLSDCISPKEEQLSKARLIHLKEVSKYVQLVLAEFAKSDAKQSEEAARALVSKHSAEALANNVAPPLELLAALRFLKTIIPCEHAGAYQPGSYHSNLDGILKGFSSGENRQAWYDKRYFLVVQAGSWEEIEIENCDADFTLQYGVKGFTDKQASEEGPKKEHFSMDAIVNQVNVHCDKSEQVYQCARDIAKEREPEAYQRLISKFPTSFGPSNEKVTQPDTTIISLYQSALSTLPILWRVATEIAGEDAVSVKWSIKGLDRLAKKVLQKYNGDVSQVTDVCRVSIVFERIEGLVAALERLVHPYKVTVIKNRFKDVADGGYSDVLANIMLPGHVCEVQLHLQSIYEVKSEVGHRVYKWYRRLADGGTTAAPAGLVVDTSDAAAACLSMSQSAPAGTRRTSSPTRRLSANGRQVGPKDEAGLLHGDDCTCDLVNGDRSTGQMQHGKMHGRGSYAYADGDVFEGEFDNDSFVRGVYRCSNGNVYEGGMRGSDWHGEGTMTETNGDIKAGKWLQSSFLGGKWTMGTQVKIFPAGAIWEGAVAQKEGAASLEGQGKLTIGECVYEGSFVGCRLNGQGTLWRGGRLEFEGEWVSHSRKKGTYRDAAGGVMVGEFNAKGAPHGQLEATQANGMVIQGEWKDGKPWQCEVLAQGKVVAMFKDGQQVQPQEAGTAKQGTEQSL